MWIMVEVFVAAALFLGTFWIWWRITKRDFWTTVVLTFFSSFFLVVILSKMAGNFGSTTVDTWQGDVLSIKPDPHSSAVFIRVSIGDQLRSYKTDNLKLQEVEKEGIVVQYLEKKRNRYPTWWPRVFRFAPEKPPGKPEFVIKARPEKIKEIFASL